MSDERNWQPTSALTINRKVTTCVDVRTVTTYRWKPYKPDGQRQMKAQGRWQRAAGSGDYAKWENCSAPDGEWTLNTPKELTA